MSRTHLLVDLGNTRLKWTIAVDGVLVREPVAQPWSSFASAPALPLPEWRALGVEAVGIASVAPTHVTARVDAALHALAVPVFRPGSQARWHGLRCAYRHPEHLGIDRWLALIAAYRRDPARRYTVISAGTALTVDVLDPQGAHRGGVIAPGLAAMRSALLAAAPALARHDAGTASTGLGADSGDAIARGCLQALLGVVERHARDAGGAPRSLLLAGGDAAVLAPHLQVPVELAPALVLEGLARWMQDAMAGRDAR